MVQLHKATLWPSTYLRLRWCANDIHAEIFEEGEVEIRSKNVDDMFRLAGCIPGARFFDKETKSFLTVSDYTPQLEDEVVVISLECLRANLYRGSMRGVFLERFRKTALASLEQARASFALGGFNMPAMSKRTGSTWPPLMFFVLEKEAEAIASFFLRIFPASMTQGRWRWGGNLGALASAIRRMPLYSDSKAGQAIGPGKSSPPAAPLLRRNQVALQVDGSFPTMQLFLHTAGVGYGDMVYVAFDGPDDS